MTKNEKQIMIDKLGEYAVANGYYQAAVNSDIAHGKGKDTQLLKDIESTGHNANIIIDLMRSLGIDNAGALKAEFVRQGHEQYQENHNAD